MFRAAIAKLFLTNRTLTDNCPSLPQRTWRVLFDGHLAHALFLVKIVPRNHVKVFPHQSHFH